MPPNCTCVADDEEALANVGGNSLGGETAMPQNCTRVEDDEGDGGGVGQGGGD